MKETINFVFNENEVPNRATAHSLTTGEKQIVSKDLVLEKLTSLKKDFSNVSCRTRKGEVSSTFVFKYKKNNQELLARVILNNNDPFYESVSNLSELYKVNKKYKKLLDYENKYRLLTGQTITFCTGERSRYKALLSMEKEEIVYRNLIVDILNESTSAYPTRRLLDIATEELYNLYYNSFLQVPRYSYIYH